MRMALEIVSVMRASSKIIESTVMFTLLTDVRDVWNRKVFEVLQVAEYNATSWRCTQ